ncbi:unnamed protein product [Nyctereutes procyonoides]|uniref:(raccoon dog) hypothetical protein n=1 Tax=Nyctereutes procyonoides TaxID=34880 RepID=A0A811XYP1_NYCPR|nr:unnamed protein product [Nyctereutes procyonoides]
MLFWHTQPEHYNQHSSGSYLRDVLALPIFKQEEPQLSPENEARLPPLQYVLCAATSPAVKLHEETLTYLNQDQSYEIRLLENRKLGDFQDLNTKYVKSIIQVVFHDRRLQYTEHQRLEGWQRSRPGHRILDIDIPPSVGILDPRASPTQLNAVEFLWDPSKRATAFIQDGLGGLWDVPPPILHMFRSGGNVPLGQGGTMGIPSLSPPCPSFTHRERQRHRQREKQAPYREPDMGLDPRTPRAPGEREPLG